MEKDKTPKPKVAEWRTPLQKGGGKGRNNDVSDLSSSEDEEWEDLQSQVEMQRRVNKTFHGIASYTAGPRRGKSEEEAANKLTSWMYDLLLEALEGSMASLMCKFGLQPREEFGTRESEHFGTVPELLDEATKQYVHEVCKSMVFFIRKDVLEGAVFHVFMVNENNIPVTQSRVVFRTRGLFSPANLNVSDASAVHKTRGMVQKQLIDLLHGIHSAAFEELKCPWYSSWNLSLGLKKEFIAFLKQNGYTDPLAPFTEDAARHYFPWKKRPRLSQAYKLGLLPDRSNGKYLTRRNKTPLPTKQPNTQSPTVGDGEVKQFEKESLNHQATPGSLRKEVLEWEYFSSSSESESERGQAEDDGCVPLSVPKKPLNCPIFSSEVLPSVMMLVYRVEYANKIRVTQSLIQQAEKEKRRYEEFMKPG